MGIYCKRAVYIIVLLHFSYSYADDYDEDVDSTSETFDDEWHMDFMPTGYLPDSVYRELAWYGILQIQPIHHSSKYKVAAQLIWQHTLGRPHVIMENPPQSTQSPGKISRQILAEDAAKWSREQRAGQEVLMENIKSGGNGLTVRTVISATTKTVYIIQNGNYYTCPSGTQPDVDTYRVQANMHERKCTFGKPSEQVPIDPCIEAEVAPIEYSFHEGWMFCLGNGDRENNYFQNGTLDCGNKTKITVEEFFEMCAIDQNIVITFDYFGDEPRKDMVHNATLCTTWDPCRLSYLYRLEPPPIDMTPSFPTSSQNPCDSTVCPDCLEGATEDIGVPIDIDSDDEEEAVLAPSESPGDVVEGDETESTTEETITSATIPKEHDNQQAGNEQDSESQEGKIPGSQEDNNQSGDKLGVDKQPPGRRRKANKRRRLH